MKYPVKKEKRITNPNSLLFGPNCVEVEVDERGGEGRGERREEGKGSEEGRVVEKKKCLSRSFFMQLTLEDNLCATWTGGCCFSQLTACYDHYNGS